jgi:hypothetical protein
MGVKCMLLYKLPKGRSPDKEDAGTYNSSLINEKQQSGECMLPGSLAALVLLVAHCLQANLAAEQQSSDEQMHAKATERFASAICLCQCLCCIHGSSLSCCC